MPKQQTDPDEPDVARRFIDWLAEQRKGRTQNELTDALHNLIEACKDTGKKGSVTLTVSVKPEGGRMVMISDKIDTKLPKPDRDSALFYVTDDNELSKDDPDQRRLPLQEVGETPAHDAKEVSG
jgi:hypothetical protein